MGESDTRIMERFGTLLLKLSLSLSPIFFSSVLGAGPRLRASDCATRLRLQVDYSRWTPPQLVVAPRLAEAHFHGKPEQSAPPNRTGKRHISLGEERLALSPVLEPNSGTVGAMRGPWIGPPGVLCGLSARSLWMCALGWPFIFIFRGWAPGCGKRPACTESRLAQNFFFSADQNRCVVNLCITSTAWN